MEEEKELKMEIVEKPRRNNKSKIDWGKAERIIKEIAKKLKDIGDDNKAIKIDTRQFLATVGSSGNSKSTANQIVRKVMKNMGIDNIKVHIDDQKIIFSLK